MKKIFCKGFAFLFAFSFLNANAQPTTLSAGDIAFTGLNCTDNTINGTTSNDDFVFVLLKNIKAGTVIYFTDFGWQVTDQAFQSANPCGASTGAVADGVVKWTAGTDMNYGTQILIRSKFSPTTNYGTVVGYQSTYNVSTQYVNIATSGESLFAYQGSLASPVLLAGINVNSSGWDNTLTRCLFTSTPSALPSALSTNNYAFTLNFTGNVRVKNSVTFTGNAANDRASLANTANWDMSNTSTALAMPSPNPVVILPLTLTSFTGSTSAQKNNLEWRVAGEAGISGFGVERSEDGVAFTSIGFVPAYNNGPHTYNFDDQNPQRDYYYRLKMAEQNGNYTYAKSILLKRKTQQEASIVAKQDGVLFKGEASDGGNISLLNLSGAVLTTVAVKSGEAFLPWSKMPVGIYIVRYANNATQQTFKVSKQN